MAKPETAWKGQVQCCRNSPFKNQQLKDGQKPPYHHQVAKLESSTTLFQPRQLLAGFPPLHPLWEAGALQAKTAYFLDIL